MVQVIAKKNRAVYVLFILVICILPPDLAAKNGLKIDILGVSKDVKENILILLDNLDVSQRSSIAFTKKKIRRAMIEGSEPLGLYDIEFDTRIGSDKITISVKSYTSLVWSKPQIEIQGAIANAKEFEQIVASANAAVGSRMTHEFYETIKSRLITIYLNNGYLDAHFSQSSLEVSVINSSARVVLVLESGEQYYFSPLRFVGGHLNDVFLHKMTTFKEGEAYERAKVESFYQQLIDSRYFSSVKIEREKNSDHTVTLVVLLDPSPRYRYSTGFGFATDVGPRIKIGVDRPWINRRGHQWKAQSKVSSIIKVASSEYRIPLYLGWVDAFVWSVGWQDKSVDDTESEKFTTGFGLHREIHRWVGSVSLNIENERDEQGSLLRSEDSYIYIGTQWTRTRIWGDARNPVKGYKFWGSIESSTEGLGAESDFTRGEFGNKWLQGVAEKHSFLMKATMGFIQTGNFQNIPSTKRFFVGGDQTIRGYDYESLSQEDENGDQLGGRYLNTVGVEYRYQIFSKWQVSVFGDAGRAYNVSEARMNVGGGVGVRWISPIGPLNIDVAYPIGDDNVNGARLHVYMGPVI
ncbi:MAG: BamA/TamA family outer membrane protein [Pseudomonadales bacterium]|nr:BamA/TamA family outer membrane protein [Pseudomonadales bacterium]